MTWALEAGDGGGTGPRWAKWIDRAGAMAHLRVLRSELGRADTLELMSDQHEAEGRELEMHGTLDSTSGRQVLSVEELAAWRADRLRRQVEKCRVLAVSLRGFALACDVDVFGLAPYAPGRIAGDDGGGDYDGTPHPDRPGFPPEPLYTNFGRWRQAAWSLLQASNADVQHAVATGGDVLLDIFPRVDFDADGGVFVRSDVQNPASGSDRREGKTTDPNGWNDWSGWVVKTWVPPAGAASSRVECTALMPLSLTWALLERAARLVVARGIDGTMSLSAGWVAARNARLSRILGGTGLPSTIVEASAAADVQALGNGEPDATVMRLVGLAAAIVAAINPVAGLVVGVLVGLAGLLYRVIPSATAYAVDAWGHRQPFLQAFNHTGTLAPHAAPTHAVPPPAYVVAPDPSELVPFVGVPFVRREAESSGGFAVKGLALVILARLLLGS